MEVSICNIAWAIKQQIRDRTKPSNQPCSTRQRLRPRTTRTAPITLCIIADQQCHLCPCKQTHPLARQHNRGKPRCTFRMLLYLTTVPCQRTSWSGAFSNCDPDPTSTGGDVLQGLTISILTVCVLELSILMLSGETRHYALVNLWSMEQNKYHTSAVKSITQHTWEWAPQWTKRYSCDWTLLQ